jgi:N-acetylglutamate synthase-like GNAT family acetyltransferase
MARLDGEVAGGASLYLHEKTALLCGAATLPASRRRGVQSALLQTRLGRAREFGCDLAVVTTQPGSKSQENVQRAGFELIYSRAILIKEP